MIFEANKEFMENLSLQSASIRLTFRILCTSGTCILDLHSKTPQSGLDLAQSVTLCGKRILEVSKMTPTSKNPIVILNKNKRTFIPQRNSNPNPQARVSSRKGIELLFVLPACAQDEI